MGPYQLVKRIYAANWGATRDRQWQQYLRAGLDEQKRVYRRSLTVTNIYSTGFHA